MPRSLWVIEVLVPKMNARGNEWLPVDWQDTKREATSMAARGWPGKRSRVRRWSPVEGR